MNTILRFLLLLPLAAFGQPAAPLKSVATVADLTNRFPVPGEYVQVQGYRTNGDWGDGRTMRHNPTSTNAVDNGCVFSVATGEGRWEAPDCEGGRVNVRYFGAWGNGTSNDLPYIRAAGSKLQLMGGGIFEAPPGTYMLRSSVRGDLVCYFSNLVDVAFHMDGAMFTSDDFADDEWISAGLVNVGSAATATTAIPHGMVPGDSIVVKNEVDRGYNGMFIVSATNGPTEVSFNLSGYETPPGMGSGLIHLTDSSRTIFAFKNCQNVNMGRVRFSGTVLRRAVQYQIGWAVALFLDGCRTIRGEIYATGAQAGWASGLYDLDRGRCEDFDVTFSGEDVGYPVRLNGSGHRSKFRVYANSIHRGAYAGGVEDSDFELYVRDYDVTGVILTTQPILGTTLQGNKNLTVLVDDTGTTEEIDLVAVGGTRYMATLAGYDVDAPVTNSNIRVTVRGRNMPDTSIMQSVTYRTNHWIDGLHLSGNVDQGGLAEADVRHDFYFDQSASQGQYRGIEIENLIVLPPTNTGAYNARLRIANLHDNPRVNNYRSGMPFNYAFPIGREIDVVPVFPGFEYITSEQMQMQQLSGGLVLNYSAVSHALPYSVSSNSLTAQWVGKVPASGDLGLFAVGPHPDYATNNSLGLSVRSGSLIARLYGATKADYRQLEVVDWQSAHGGLISEVSLVRTNGGVAIFADGHRQATVETSTNSAPDWSGEIVGSYAVVGTEDADLGFSGAVYRMAIWDYDRQTDFPSLATAWTSGQSAQGAVSDTIGLSVLNGGFETAGGGGSDVFADWVESTSGSSTITQTNDAAEGVAAVAFNVDATNSFASLTLNPPMTIGASYRVSLRAKTTASNGGAISLVGPIDGEAVIQLTNGWQSFVLNKVWGGTTFSVKRADGASRSLLVDAIEVRRTGAILDMDWTKAGADLLTGRRPTYSAETVTRVVPRTSGISDDRGDANVTLYPGQDAPIQLFATGLTTGRTVSFYDALARIGDGFRIIRTGVGPGTLTAAGVAITPGTWVDFAYDGSDWVVAASGTGVSTSGGALSRTPDWVNVLDYGADPLGVSDSTSAIQAAIDSLPLPTTNTIYGVRGGTVFIPKGVYLVTAPLRMRPGKIEGGSRFGTVIVNQGITNDVIACITPAGTPPTGIWLYRVAHLSIHQAAGVTPTSGAGIRVQSDDGVTASMVDVEDVFMHGLYRGFHGSALQGSSLKDVTVYAAREDGILWDVYQTMVHASGCWTYYCGQDGTGHGWHLQGPAYCTVTASGADSNYGWGWYIEPGSDQNPVGGTYAVGGEQNSKGGMFIKGARGGVYTPMLVTRAGNSPPADGIVLDHCLRVSLVGAFTQQHGSGAIGYPLRVTNAWAGYPSAVVVGSYLNSYNDGTNYHQVLGEVTSLVHEERGFLGINTDGIPRRMLDIHDRTGAVGNTTGHELARLALHTADTNGNAYISLSPDGETTFHRIIANNLSTNTVFNYGTNGDTVFLGPSAPLSGDNGSFLFQLGTTPVMSIKGGDTLGGVGIGTTRPNPAAMLEVRSSTRGLLLPVWASTEYTGGIYGSGQYTPPGLLSYDSTDRRVRVQTRNAADGLTNNQYTTLFGYVDRDLRLGTAHRQIGKIWPQSVHATDTNIGSVYIYFTAENVCGLEIEQNSLRAAPFQFGTFGDSILRNNYEGSAGAYGNLQIMAGTHAGVIVSNGTHRGSVSIRTNLFVTGDLVRSNGMTLTGSLDSKAATNHTHDASNTVSGQFESARLGSGTSDTDTFLRGGDTPTWDQLSADDIPNLPASRITSGTFDPARLGTGTATTNTFLQGDGSGGALWGTIPSVASPTNGIADAPADGIFYGRLNNAWTQPDISHLSGVSGWGLAWIDGTVADDVDALTTLGLLGGGPATIDSPATYAVRVGSGGTISTRHRLNLIASTGLSLSLSDDSINDESDVTVSIADRDWGDITSTSSGTVWNIDADAVGANEIASNAVGTSEIDDNAVTYAKIQNVAASRVLGRGAGSGDGDPQELLIGEGLAQTGVTIHTNPVVVAAARLIGRAPGTDGAAHEVEVGEGLGWDGAKIVNTASVDTAPFAIAAFTHVSDTESDGEAQTIDATNSAGVSAVWMSAGGIFRITLTSTQPTSPYKRVAVGTVSPSEEVFSASVMDQPPDYDSTGTTIYVFVQGGVFEGQQIMLRLYNY